MALEIIAKLVQVNPIVTGTGQRGEWKKREMIVETIEQYPKKICLLCWNDKAEQVESLKPGSELKIGINLESREYNGRWYTDVRAWRIDLSSGASAGFSGNQNSNYNQSAPSNNYADSPSMPPPSQANDDLPF